MKKATSTGHIAVMGGPVNNECQGKYLMLYFYHCQTGPLIISRTQGGIAMPYFIILSNLTDEGRKTIKQKPERIVEVNKEIEAMGVKVLKQYALLGMYDFVNIVEAPDNESVMKMSVELGSRGSVTMTTLPAIPVEEFIKKIK
jgi:uncharacterized protein with GYD domain